MNRKTNFEGVSAFNELIGNAQGGARNDARAMMRAHCVVNSN